jgi:hypothetical protein
MNKGTKKTTATRPRFSAPMFRMDKGSWQAGFEAGKQGKPNKPPANIDSLSFRSGYIEGKAERPKKRKRNPLGIPLPTPQGIALHLVGSKLHLVGSKLLRKKNPGGTATFAEGSPYKGKVRKANPASKVVQKPLVLVLTHAESKAINGGGSTAAMVRKAFAAAKESGKAGWDHIVVEHPGGEVAFTLIP